MEIPDDAPDPPHWHPLCLLLYALAAGALVLSLGLAWAATPLAADSWMVLASAGVVLIAALFFLAAGGSFHRRKERRAAILLTIGLLGAAAGFVPLAQGPTAFVAVLPILILAILLPFVRFRTSLWILVAAWAVGTAVMVTNALWSPIVRFPLWIDLVARAGGYLALLTLTIGLFYRYYHHLQDSLDRARSERQALHHASRRLEASNNSLRATRAHLEKTNRSLQESQEELRRSNRATMMFLNSAAHELRTPMTPVLMHTNLLRRTPTCQEDPRVRASLLVIDRNMIRLKDHLDDLLETAQLRAEPYSFRPEETSLDTLLRELRDTYEPLADQNKIRLEVETPPILVRADAKRIMQVLQNLVTNAIEATPPDGSVRVTAKKQDGSCVIQVADTGRGLDPQERELAFEPFTKTRTQSTDGGTGLGLYISRSIVEGHGGQLQSMSPGPGKGTVFRFTLPLVQTKDIRPRPPALGPPAGSRRSPHGPPADDKAAQNA